MIVWTEEKIDELRTLAGQGHAATYIGQQFGCSQPNISARAKRYNIKLLCTSGTGGLRRGRPLRVPFIDGEMAKIPLTKGLFAIIDIADIPLVAGRNWSGTLRDGHPIKVSSQPKIGLPEILLHRHLTGVPIELCVDHKDGNAFNNRRDNLRVCTYSENCFNKRISKHNKSGKSGVSWKNNKWEAKIVVRDHIIRLGRFTSFEDAVNARLEGERIHFGEFARPHERASLGLRSPSQGEG